MSDDGATEDDRSGSGSATEDDRSGSRSATEDDPAIAVQGLDRSFGDLRVLHGLTFEIERGTVAALVGPNGSGKSTLLRVIGGLLEPTAGRVSIAGGGTRDVGYLAQTPVFHPAFTVAETVSFYASLVGTPGVVDETIERVGLTPVADRPVSALSGGMTRLLGLALTTLGDPSLLLLDEPASGLDPMMTTYIGGVIDDVAETGDTVLLATHDLAAVEQVADVVLVLDRGRLAAMDGPDALLEAAGADSLEAAMHDIVDAEVPTVYAGTRGGDGR